MGFLPAGPCFRMVSAVNAQTYGTVTLFYNSNILIISRKGKTVWNISFQTAV